MIDNNVIRGTEYQLTDALENMKKKGKKFYTGQVNEWLDCGNKNATVLTNQRLLATYGNNVSENIMLENSKIIEPCCIADGVKITNSVIGPHVSVGKNSVISNSVISNSIVQTNTTLKNEVMTNSMIGNFVSIEKKIDEYSIGDYNQL